jgi:F-type H+-transporting ATPase subunit alpha
LKLAYAQFEELETFSRFGTRLDEETRARLEHGRRVRQVLVQPQYAPIPPAEQVAVLLAVSEGLLDAVPVDRVGAAAARVREEVREHDAAACEALEHGAPLDQDLRERLLATARAAVDALRAEDEAVEAERRGGGEAAPA